MDIRIVPAAMIAAFFCVTLILALRPAALALGLIDTPGGRKRHIGKVPVIGGIGMYLGFAAGVVVAAPSAETAYLLAGSLFLVIIGFVDDRFDLPPSVRLGTQFAAVLMMYFGGGAVVTTMGDPFALGRIELHHLSLVVTVFMSIAVINAVNMTDGMDGLAGGLVLVALLGLCVAGAGTAVFAPAIVAAAAVIAFLGFNFPLKLNRPFRTFMGDAGSTFLGFLVTWLLVRASQPPVSAISPVVALGLVAVPLFDLTSCFFRRVLSGRSPFAADNIHLHHVLLDSGIGRRVALAVLLTIAAVVAALCMAMEAAGISDAVIFAVWLACGVAVDQGVRIYRRAVVPAA